MVNITKRRGRITRIVLVASLALNVAVVGGAIGMLASGRGHDGPPQRVMFDFGPLGSVLDADDRRAIGQAMRKGGSRPLNRQELDSKIDVLATTLRTMPFDVNAVQEIMAPFRVRSEQIQMEAQEAFLSRLTTMSPQARAALADRLQHKPPKRN